MMIKLLNAYQAELFEVIDQAAGTALQAGAYPGFCSNLEITPPGQDASPSQVK
jgi:hypothetical protein